MFEIFQNKKLGKSHSTDSSTVCVCVCVCREYHGLSLYLEIFGSISIQESKCDHCLFKTSNGWSCSDAWKGCLGVLLPEGRACSHPAWRPLPFGRKPCSLATCPVKDVGCTPHCSSRVQIQAWWAWLCSATDLPRRWEEVMPWSCQLQGSVLGFCIITSSHLHSLLGRFLP